MVAVSILSKFTVCTALPSSFEMLTLYVPKSESCTFLMVNQPCWLILNFFPGEMSAPSLLHWKSSSESGTGVVKSQCLRTTVVPTLVVFRTIAHVFGIGGAVWRERVLKTTVTLCYSKGSRLKSSLVPCRGTPRKWLMSAYQ